MKIFKRHVRRFYDRNIVRPIVRLRRAWLSNSSNAKRELDIAHHRVCIGIATMPSRKKQLLETLKTLEGQADEIVVYLNGFDFPEAREEFPEIEFVLGGDLGDVGKFYPIWDGFEGIFVACDDDILFPKDFVSTLRVELCREAIPVAVSFHGSIVHDFEAGYYTSGARRIIEFSRSSLWPAEVDVIGTGCLAFWSQDIDLSHDYFVEKNVTDLIFSLAAFDAGLILKVIPHFGGELREQDTGESISGDSQLQKVSRLNVNKVASKYLRLLRDYRQGQFNESSSG